jgi:hypothetical protein
MRWLRRPDRRGCVGIAAGLAAFAVTAVLAVTHDGHAGSAALPVAAAGPLGPERVPVPDAPAPARERRLSVAEQTDGISCQAGERVLLHIHAHLTIFVRGIARRVPAGIGIAPPHEVEQTPSGVFVAGGTCFTWLHTHADDGIVHIESPIERTYTLGEFFDIWGQPLGREQVGPAHGPVAAFVNGRIVTGDPRQIPLLAHAQIQLEVGRPLIAPDRITFPKGL